MEIEGCKLWYVVLIRTQVAQTRDVLTTDVCAIMGVSTSARPGLVRSKTAIAPPAAVQGTAKYRSEAATILSLTPKFMLIRICGTLKP